MPNENEEVVIEKEEEVVIEEEGKKEEVNWEAKAKELEGRLKRAETKASKKSEPTKTEPAKEGLDYGQKAFLVASGIKGEAELKLVQEVMSSTGKTLEQVLESKYFQAELEERREIAKTAEAVPNGKRSGNIASDSVEYWMSKPMAEVPQEMRIKVVNAKLKQGEGKGVFYNS